MVGVSLLANTGSDLAGDFEKWREKAWLGVSFDSTNFDFENLPPLWIFANLPLGSLKTFHLDLRFAPKHRRA